MSPAVRTDGDRPTSGGPPAMMVHTAAPMSAEPDETLSKLLELPEGRTVIGAVALAKSVLSETGLHHAVGAEGSEPALVARALASASERPVLYVTPDLDSARRAADDLVFLARNATTDGQAADATTLLFTPSETSPYAEVHPERRAAMVRLATLFHLAKRLPFRFLVAPA